MRTLIIRRLLSVVILGLALGSLSPTASAGATPDRKPLPTDSVYQLEAALVDQDGRALRFRDLRSKPRVVTFIYTSCQYVCPMIVSSVKAIERELAPAAVSGVGFVLITMDPARDTPAVLKRLMTERRLDASRWQLLQPSPDELRGLAGVLGMRYRSLADGEFNHTTTMVLLDGEGRVVARSDRIGAKADPEFLAAIARASAAPAN